MAHKNFQKVSLDASAQAVQSDSVTDENSNRSGAPDRGSILEASSSLLFSLLYVHFQTIPFLLCRHFRGGEENCVSHR